MPKRILLTGGAGFIGSAVARQIIGRRKDFVMVFDALTYAGNLASLESVERDPLFSFCHGNICNAAEIRAALNNFQPDIVMHLAAETHVDRSIDGPDAFIQSNIVGTFTLLEACLDYWKSRPATKKTLFRFHHISTDEVFGSLGPQGRFTEATAYAPNSPYSASKAASDHLVRAWHRTFGLPVLVTHCSNNYGPYQFPEKLIPLIIINALAGRFLPVYGTGANVRDWLHVEDHARALMLVADRGRAGETYIIGGNSERSNISVVEAICDLLDALAPDEKNSPRRRLIRFVPDRPGHDLRYAVDSSKLRQELGWAPLETFESGLRRTVIWFLENRKWSKNIRANAHLDKRPELGEQILGATSAANV